MIVQNPGKRYSPWLKLTTLKPPRVPHVKAWNIAGGNSLTLTVCTNSLEKAGEPKLLDIISKIISSVLTALYQPFWFSLLAAGLFLFLYLYAAEHVNIPVR